MSSPVRAAVSDPRSPGLRRRQGGLAGPDQGHRPGIRGQRCPRLLRDPRVGCDRPRRNGRSRCCGRTPERDHSATGRGCPAHLLEHPRQEGTRTASAWRVRIVGRSAHAISNQSPASLASAPVPEGAGVGNHRAVRPLHRARPDHRTELRVDILKEILRGAPRDLTDAFVAFRRCSTADREDLRAAPASFERQCSWSAE